MAARTFEFERLPAGSHYDCIRRFCLESIRDGIRPMRIGLHPLEWDELATTELHHDDPLVSLSGSSEGFAIIILIIAGYAVEVVPEASARAPRTEGDATKGGARIIHGNAIVLREVRG